MSGGLGPSAGRVSVTSGQEYEVVSGTAGCGVFFFLVLWQHEFLLGRAIDGLL